MKDAFKERESALEEQFFHQVDQKLLAEFKKRLAEQSEREHLMAATGFTNDALLDELVQLGVSHEALAAVSLIPLVLIAWADGKLDDKEKRAVIKAAAELGIDVEGMAGKLLHSWLKQKPEPQLAETWKHYIQAVMQNSTDLSHQAWRDDILRRARAIAKVSGGTLGIDSISPAEKRVLQELENAFAAA